VCKLTDVHYLEMLIGNCYTWGFNDHEDYAIHNGYMNDLGGGGGGDGNGHCHGNFKIGTLFYYGSPIDDVYPVDLIIRTNIDELFEKEIILK
jgi:hypothetical protein